MAQRSGALQSPAWGEHQRRGATLTSSGRGRNRDGVSFAH